MEKKVVIERTYDAPLDAVWEAITNKDQMKQWYFAVSDFKPQVGFEFEFSAGREGRKYLHKCKVVESDPKNKISYTWRYDGYAGESLVTFELFSENKDKTRLKLTHAHLDTFPADQPDFASGNFNEGWNSLLGTSLAKFVEKGSFIKSTRINANPKEVWDIVIQPNDTWGLAFGGGATAETDWKEGSPIIWKDLSNNIGANGVVEVHQPEKYLQLHYYDEVYPKAGDKPGDYFEKYSVSRENGESVLTVDIGRISRREMEFHGKMWEQALGMIKRLAEKG